MSRQLPVPRGQTASDLTIPSQQSALASTATIASRLAVAAAPHVLNIVDRMATERRKQKNDQVLDAPDEALQLSEVEVDLTLPFVKKVTVRKATAWSKASTPPVIEIRQQPSGRSTMRRVGLLGLGAAGAAIAGAIALRGGSLLGPRRHVIEISGRQRG